MSELWTYEREAWVAGYATVCGVDEAGAGPLMGPVYAAAVILPRECEIPGLNDSKKLTEKKREALFDIIINTAPAPVMDQQEARPDALLVDLASIKGITGDRVIWARGLPNKDAPDASGILIAKTALRYALRKEQI